MLQRHVATASDAEAVLQIAADAVNAVNMQRHSGSGRWGCLELVTSICVLRSNAQLIRCDQRLALLQTASQDGFDSQRALRCC
jgi:hypothetical protein